MATIEQLEADPHPLLAELRAPAPVGRVDALGGWLVTRRDLALEVMRDAATFTVDDPRFSTAQVVGPSMLSRDGAEHARHRDPFARAYRLAAVRAQLTDFVEAGAARLVAALPAEGGGLRRGGAGPPPGARGPRPPGPAGARPAPLPARARPRRADRRRRLRRGLHRRRQPGSGGLPRPGRLRHPPGERPAARRVRPRPACLPRHAPGPARGARGDRGAPRPVPPAARRPGASERAARARLPQAPARLRARRLAELGQHGPEGLRPG